MSQRVLFQRLLRMIVDKVNIVFHWRRCKKWANHAAALALWFAFYNFGRKHLSLNKGKETPAMASRLEDHVWTIRKLIKESAKF